MVVLAFLTIQVFEGASARNGPKQRETRAYTRPREPRTAASTSFGYREYEARGKRGAGPGLPPERIVISTVLDPYLSLRALAAYSGLSRRTLRTYLERLPNEALPCYRLGGKILVRKSEFDAWIAQYRAQGRPSLAKAIRELGLDRINSVESTRKSAV